MHDALEEKGSPEIFRKQLKHLLGRGIVVTKSNQNLELGWNPKKCSQNLKISGSVVEHTKGGSVYYSVLGNRCFSEGLHVWDIKMLATGHDYSFDAFVGVADSSFAVSSYCGSTSHGWGYYASNGHAYHKSSKAYATKYKVGDTVSVHLNCDLRTLSFSVNGQFQGVAYKNLPLSTGFFPAVSLYRNKDAVCICNLKSFVLDSNNGKYINVSKSAGKEEGASAWYSIDESDVDIHIMKTCPVYALKTHSALHDLLVPLGHVDKLLYMKENGKLINGHHLSEPLLNSNRILNLSNAKPMLNLCLKQPALDTLKPIFNKQMKWFGFIYTKMDSFFVEFSTKDARHIHDHSDSSRLVSDCFVSQTPPVESTKEEKSNDGYEKNFIWSPAVTVKLHIEQRRTHGYDYAVVFKPATRCRVTGDKIGDISTKKQRRVVYEQMESNNILNSEFSILISPDRQIMSSQPKNSFSNTGVTSGARLFFCAETFCSKIDFYNKYRSYGVSFCFDDYSDADLNSSKKPLFVHKHIHSLQLTDIDTAWYCDSCGDLINGQMRKPRYRCAAGCDFDYCEHCFNIAYQRKQNNFDKVSPVLKKMAHSDCLLETVRNLRTNLVSIETHGWAPEDPFKFSRSEEDMHTELWSWLLFWKPV